jgi:hypothetical protein
MGDLESARIMQQSSSKLISSPCNIEKLQAEQIASLTDEITRLTAENATLKEQRDEFEREGKELCTAYGNTTITIYDLKKRAAAQKGGTQ